MAEIKKETDSLGVVEVPADKLWGAQTQRSLEHFSIGKDLIPREMITACAIVSRPPQYGSIWNWLGTEMVARLLNFAQTSREQFTASDVGYGNSNRIDLSYRRSSKLKPLGELENELQLCAQAALPSMFQHLGYTPFDPARLELEMVAHGDGAFFSRQEDTVIRPEMTSYRAISAVYYFHRLPKSFSGGVLRLYSIGGKGGSFVDIEPTNDRLIFFPSWFPHEVMPVVCPSAKFEDSRFAINCWVYGKQLPPNFYDDTGYVG
jgi:SM-20-related protein